MPGRAAFRGNLGVCVKVTVSLIDVYLAAQYALPRVEPAKTVDVVQ